MYLQKLETTDAADQVSLENAEMRCLALAAEGLDNGHIARLTGHDEIEVNRLLDSSCRKLGARNRLHAVSLAMIHGIVGAGFDN